MKEIQLTEQMKCSWQNQRNTVGRMREIHLSPTRMIPVDFPPPPWSGTSPHQTPANSLNLARPPNTRVHIPWAKHPLSLYRYRYKYRDKYIDKLRHKFRSKYKLNPPNTCVHIPPSSEQNTPLILQMQIQIQSKGYSTIKYTGVFLDLWAAGSQWWFVLRSFWAQLD